MKPNKGGIFMRKKIIIAGTIIMILGLLAVYYFFNKNTNTHVIINSIVRNDSNAQKPTVATEEPTLSDLACIKRFEDKCLCSLELNGKTVNIGDNEKDLDLLNLIGEPLSQDVTIIDKYGIHAVKKWIYQGITIEFVQLDETSPYFVDHVTIESPEFVTSKGIKIGDTFEKLKQIYPYKNELIKDDYQSSKKTTYKYNTPPLTYISFEMTDNTVSKITLYEEWP